MKQKSNKMGSGDRGRFLNFSLSSFKGKKIVSAIVALIFLFNVCTPAYAWRDGNHSHTTSAAAFGGGALGGLVTGVFILIGNGGLTSWGSVVAGAASDITGAIMYYESYDTYDETMTIGGEELDWSLGKVDITITKGQFWSMTAGIIAGCIVGVVGGVASGVKTAAAEAAKEGVKEISSEAIKEVTKTATDIAVETMKNVVVGSMIGAVAGAAGGAIVGAISDGKEGALKGLGKGAVLGAAAGAGGALLTGVLRGIEKVLASTMGDSLAGTIAENVINHTLRNALIKLPVDFACAFGALVVSRTVEEVLVQKHDMDRTLAGMIGGVAGMGARFLTQPVLMQTWTQNNYYMSNRGIVLSAGEKKRLDMVANFKKTLKKSKDKIEVGQIDAKTGEVTQSKTISVSRLADAKYIGSGVFQLENGSQVDINSNGMRGLSPEIMKAVKGYANIVARVDPSMRITGDVARTFGGGAVQDSFFAPIHSVVSVGPRPIISTATQVAILYALDYKTFYGRGDSERGKKKNYRNALKMALARSAGSLAGELSTGWLTQAYNPWSSRPQDMAGFKGWAQHTGRAVAVESGGLLADVAFARMTYAWNLNTAYGLQGLVHLGMSSLVGGTLDTLFREDRMKAEKTVFVEVKDEPEYVDEKKLVKKEPETLSEEEHRERYSAARGWEPDENATKPSKGIYVYTNTKTDETKTYKKQHSVVDVPKGYESAYSKASVGAPRVDIFFICVGMDFANNFKEASINAALMPYPYRSTGTGMGAMAANFENQDRFTRRIAMHMRGVGPVQARAIEAGQALSGQARGRFANSFGYSIANTWLPYRYQSYAAFMPDVDAHLDENVSTPGRESEKLYKDRKETKEQRQKVRQETQEVEKKIATIELSNLDKKSDDTLVALQKRLIELKVQDKALGNKLAQNKKDIQNLRTKTVNAYGDLSPIYFNGGIVNYSVDRRISDYAVVRESIQFTGERSAEEKENAMIHNEDPSQYRSIEVEAKATLERAGDDEEIEISSFQGTYNPSLAGRPLAVEHYSTQLSHGVSVNNLAGALEGAEHPLIVGDGLTITKPDQLDEAKNRLYDIMADDPDAPIYYKELKAEKDLNDQVVEKRAQEQVKGAKASTEKVKPIILVTDKKKRAIAEEMTGIVERLNGAVKGDENAKRNFGSGLIGVMALRRQGNSYYRATWVLGEGDEKKAKVARVIDDLGVSRGGGIKLQHSDKPSLTARTTRDIYGRSIETKEYGWHYDVKEEEIGVSDPQSKRKPGTTTPEKKKVSGNGGYRLVSRDLEGDDKVLKVTKHVYKDSKEAREAAIELSKKMPNWHIQIYENDEIAEIEDDKFLLVEDSPEHSLIAAISPEAAAAGLIPSKIPDDYKIRAAYPRTETTGTWKNVEVATTEYYYGPMGQAMSIRSEDPIKSQRRKKDYSAANIVDVRQLTLRKHEDETGAIRKVELIENVDGEEKVLSEFRGKEGENPFDEAVAYAATLQSPDPTMETVDYDSTGDQHYIVMRDPKTQKITGFATKDSYAKHKDAYAKANELIDGLLQGGGDEALPKDTIFEIYMAHEIGKTKDGQLVILDDEASDAALAEAPVGKYALKPSSLTGRKAPSQGPDDHSPDAVDFGKATVQAASVAKGDDPNVTYAISIYDTKSDLEFVKSLGDGGWTRSPYVGGPSGRLIAQDIHHGPQLLSKNVPYNPNMPSNLLKVVRIHLENRFLQEAGLKELAVDDIDVDTEEIVDEMYDRFVKKAPKFKDRVLDVRGAKGNKEEAYSKVMSNSNYNLGKIANETYNEVVNERFKRAGLNDQAWNTMMQRPITRMESFQFFENKNIAGKTYSLPTWGAKAGYNAARRPNRDVVYDALRPNTMLSATEDYVLQYDAGDRVIDITVVAGETIEDALAREDIFVSRKEYTASKDGRKFAVNKDKTFNEAEYEETGFLSKPKERNIVLGGDKAIRVGPSQSPQEALKEHEIIGTTFISEEDFVNRVVAPNEEMFTVMVDGELPSSADGGMRFVKSSFYDYRPEQVRAAHAQRIEAAKKRGDSAALNYWKSSAVIDVDGVAMVVEPGEAGVNPMYRYEIQTLFDDYMDTMIGITRSGAGTGPTIQMRPNGIGK
ncbi:MAG: hypothetical protein GY858_06150 [Candidatus Omnitrophica bacterium]|nr:hypothetical protein [Candidatus Omnitrophota bacterium]